MGNQIRTDRKIKVPEFQFTVGMNSDGGEAAPYAENEHLLVAGSSYSGAVLVADASSGTNYFKTMDVIDGGVASSTSILSGGTQTVGMNGSATGTDIISGGSQVILEGGRADSTSLLSSGFMIVSSGGFVGSASGFDSLITMEDGASYDNVHVDGGVRIGSGYSAFIQRGGSGSNLSISAGSAWVDGGSIGSVTLYDGLLTLGGGVVSNMIQMSGTMRSSAGSLMNGVTLLGGTFFAGGTYENLTVDAPNGGVFHEGTGTDIEIKRGFLTLTGGTVARITVSSGGRLGIQRFSINDPGRGKAFGVEQLEGGILIANIGGNDDISYMSGNNVSGSFLVDKLYASGLILYSGAVQNVWIGGSSYDGKVSSGGLQYVSGGSASTTSVFQGGVQIVQENGATFGTVVSQGGSQRVSTGRASDTVVSFGGLQDVYAEGNTSGTIVSIGGTQIVRSGGAAVSTIVDSDGLQVVSSGSTVRDTTVLGGGMIQAAEGAHLTGTTVLKGHLITSNTILGNMDSAVTVDKIEFVPDNSEIMTIFNSEDVKLVINSHTTPEIDYSLSLLINDSAPLHITNAGELVLSGALHIAENTSGTLSINNSGKLTIADIPGNPTPGLINFGQELVMIDNTGIFQASGIRNEGGGHLYIENTGKAIEDGFISDGWRLSEGLTEFRQPHYYQYAGFDRTVWEELLTEMAGYLGGQSVALSNIGAEADTTLLNQAGTMRLNGDFVSITGRSVTVLNDGDLYIGDSSSGNATAIYNAYLGDLLISGSGNFHVDGNIVNAASGHLNLGNVTFDTDGNVNSGGYGKFLISGDIVNTATGHIYIGLGNGSMLGTGTDFTAITNYSSGDVVIHMTGTTNADVNIYADVIGQNITIAGNGTIHRKVAAGELTSEDADNPAVVASVMLDNIRLSSTSVVYGVDQAIAGQTAVLITNGADIQCNVYGGGNGVSVGNGVTLKVADSTVAGNMAGGGYSASVAGDIKLQLENSVLTGLIYGGGYNGTAEGNVTVTMTGGSVSRYLFGGSYQAAVAGKTELNLEGGIIHNATGGGYAGGIGILAESGDVLVNIGSMVAAADNSSLFGGGYAGSGGRSTVGEVIIDVGAIATYAVLANLYGGGFASGTDSKTENGNVAINLANSTARTASSAVFGGGLASGRAISVTGDVRLSVVAGAALSYVYGGGRGTAGGTAETGEVSIAVSGGILNGYLYGGGWADTGSVSTAERAVLTITGGTFNNYVSGGGFANGGAAAVTGDVEITISGGTFAKTVFGGGQVSTVAGGTSAVQGDITITLDCSTGPIQFGTGAGVTLGAQGNSAIGGDVASTSTMTMVLSGNGDNLRTGDSVFSGILNGAGGKSRGSTRILRFDDFVAEQFNARVTGFTEIVATGGSRVNFTANFALAAGTDFTFDLTGRDASLAGTAMYAQTGNLSITSSTNFTIMVTADDLLNAGTSGSFRLLSGAVAPGVLFGSSCVNIRYTDSNGVLLSDVLGGVNDLNWGWLYDDGLESDLEMRLAFDDSSKMFSLEWQYLNLPSPGSLTLADYEADFSLTGTGQPFKDGLLA